MKEVYGNIWDYHEQGSWIVITTNGSIKVNGKAVMGRGVAFQASMKFPALPLELGKELRYGNFPKCFPSYKIFTFPVKHQWFQKASLALIIDSCVTLKRYCSALLPGLSTIYMVRPGCGNGQLDWSIVKPVLENHLDYRFTIVEWAKEGK